MFAKLLGMFSADMAIDLGTANTLVYVRGRGIVLNEPSVVAMEEYKGRRHVLAVGNEAKQMLGRTPGNIQAIRPLKDGVIADFDIAEDMIKYFICKVHDRHTFVTNLIIICVPSGSTAVERRAIHQSAIQAGAHKVLLIEEPMAAAVAYGLELNENQIILVYDFGGGTFDVTILRISDGEFTRLASGGDDKLGGEDFTQAQIKKEIGSASVPERGEGRTVEIKGRDLVNGVPKEIVITERQVAESLQEPVAAIVEAVKIALENTAPELAADIVDKGIVLTGGGALLANLDQVLRKATGLPVTVAEEPLACVAKGSGKALDEVSRLKSALSTI